MEDEYWNTEWIAQAVADATNDAEARLRVTFLQERGDLPWTKNCAYSFTVSAPNGQRFEVIVHEVTAP